ncbi:hypothetical protein H4219_003412 [Mycoemilia scoparia]|uniref:Uncharacterized protein n=1 Tax=Mycoemilia scoparia TaxID=417184 RepID=A0A9W8DT00_9FUNG|nr:hypothetical protein H4219_003412 [Mycoemilia scoparia]
MEEGYLTRKGRRDNNNSNSNFSTTTISNTALNVTTANNKPGAEAEGGDGNGNDNDLTILVNQRLIYQAGVDFEGRPMFIFAVCNLPDPKKVNYNALLKAILERVGELLEGDDYSLVLFSSGAKYQPGWKWVLSAYYGLDYKIKKNLKALYVVHPLWWTKLFFSVMGRVISPKFFRKIVWIDNLSKLMLLVPVHQISIPAEVLAHNKKIGPNNALFPSFTAEAASSASRNNKSKNIMAEGKEATNPTTTTKNGNADADDDDEKDNNNNNNTDAGKNSSSNSIVFGATVSQLMKSTSEEIRLHPVAVQLMRFIYQNGLDVEGIFRRSPASTQIKEAKAKYNSGQQQQVLLDESVGENGGVHLAALLLKLLFKEQPEPIFGPKVVALLSGLPKSNNTNNRGDGGHGIANIETSDSTPEVDSDDGSGQDVGPPNDTGSSSKVAAAAASPTRSSAAHLVKLRTLYTSNTILPAFSGEPLMLLTCLFALLNRIARHNDDTQQSKMSPHNLAIVWAPNLYWTDDPLSDINMYTASGSSNSSSNTLGSLLVLLIDHFDMVFESTLVEKFGYEPSSSPESNSNNNNNNNNDGRSVDPALWVINHLESLRFINTTAAGGSDDN